MDLSVIIVSWNVKDKLKENLKALRNSEGNFMYEIFVVDNNSADGSAEMVKKEFPEIKLIANNNNLGFSKANNQAIRKAQGNFILLLNPDMRVEKDTLRKMLEWMRENKQASVAGCKLINGKGEMIKHARRFPGFLDQLAITLKIPHVLPAVLNNYLQKNFDYNKAGRADSIRGSFFMIRKEAVEKIGLLDESFFIWFEEVDYCKRIKEGGGEVWYTPAAECIDYIGQSFGQVPRGKTQRYFRDSMLYYFYKWHPRWQFLILKISWNLSSFLLFFSDLSQIKSKAKT